LRKEDKRQKTQDPRPKKEGGRARGGEGVKRNKIQDTRPKKEYDG